MKAVLTVTIESELKAKLEELAKEENRKLSNLVETLLFKAINDKDK